MSEVGINYFKTDGLNKYKITYENLVALANKKHWIHDLDDFNNNSETTSEKDDEVNVLQADNVQLKKQNLELTDELEKLKLEMEELKKQLVKPQEKEKKVRVSKKSFATSDKLSEQPIEDLKNKLLNLI